MPNLNITLTLTADEVRQLEDEARTAGVAPAALAETWVHERLVHEFEKAQGVPKQPKWEHRS